MGVAALVLGIISVIIALIPFCGTWAFIPAVVGLILGIIDWVKKNNSNEPKGKAVAGTICCAVAIVVIIAWWAIAFNTANKAIESVDLNQLRQELTDALDEANYTLDY